MFTRIALAALMVSMASCTALKQRFGTGEETPQLKVARADCRAKAEKEAIRKYQSTISQKEHTRIAFDACMKAKGYNRFGKKIK